MPETIYARFRGGPYAGKLAAIQYASDTLTVLTFPSLNILIPEHQANTVRGTKHTYSRGKVKINNTWLYSVAAVEWLTLEEMAYESGRISLACKCWICQS